MAADSIQIEYNQDLKPLAALLEGVERTGDFVASGAMEIPMPKLEVEGVGVLSFPVPPVQIAAHIQQSTRAPYGRGEATILDESVRKVWQLPPAKDRRSCQGRGEQYGKDITALTSLETQAGRSPVESHAGLKPSPLPVPGPKSGHWPDV